MEFEIKVISTETIKPSSPTPKCLQKHQFSFLDQLSPPFLSPMAYFYRSNPTISNSQKSYHLKKSLSVALTRFYPLPGRLVGNLYVDCNDSGVPFSEAQADCDLSQIITNPDPKNMQKFIPHNESQDLCMAVQATYLRCGSLAVGFRLSHKIADALSIILFTNTWSAVARNGDGSGLPLPKFNAAAYFPPRDISEFKQSTGILKEELTTKIFTFPASKIAQIREHYSAGGSPAQRRVSRVGALSAFIWTRFISATGMKADLVHKMCVVQHAINLRSLVHPPMSEYHFGNIVGGSITKPAVGDGSAELHQKFREAMKAVNGSYVAGLKEGEKQLNYMKEREEIMVQANRGELVNFAFTSLCGFPLYEVDFGWGKPVWAGPTGFTYKNLVIFKDTESGSGIEALIHLTKQDMEKFQAVLELPVLNSNL